MSRFESRNDLVQPYNFPRNPRQVPFVYYFALSTEEIIRQYLHPKFLMKCKPNEKYEYNDALNWAASELHCLDVVEYLIKNGADISTIDINDNNVYDDIKDYVKYKSRMDECIQQIQYHPLNKN